MTTGPAAIADPADLARHIRDIPDYPVPGVLFRDITPLLGDADALARAVEALATAVRRDVGEIDRVLGMEARGFLLGPPVALALGVGFAPVRKPGKLPWEVESETYALEYGTDTLEAHRDAVVAGERILVVDDVIATGGTAAATARLVDRLGAQVAGFAFLIELSFLDGRAALGDLPVTSLITY
ncbi:MAG TPA: adenine phosphoribosyltransferase [Iamia sp.]|nr:adenine phosphoribosyltransferase [Iamia sp.]